MKKNSLFCLLAVVFLGCGIGKSYSEKDSTDQMQGILTVTSNALEAAKGNNKSEFSKCVDETFWADEKSTEKGLDFKKLKKLVSRLRVPEDFTHQTMNIDGEKGEMGYELKSGVLKMELKEVNGNWKIFKILFSPKS
jgi:hypothetical protein